LKAPSVRSIKRFFSAISASLISSEGVAESIEVEGSCH
jgi:hypothetical protein